MFCENCGKDLGDRPEMMFCPQCGAAVEKDEKESEKSPNKSKRKNHPVIIALSVVLLIIGGGYVLLHATPKLVVKNGVCYVRDGVIKKMENWTEDIVIPERVTSIGDSAFAGCHSLRSVSLPEGLINIGDKAFFECSSLSEITLPEGLNSIGYFAFYGCSNIRTISLPESVEHLGDGAFEQSGLEKINLPMIVNDCGENIFSGTPFGNTIVNIEPVDLDYIPYSAPVYGCEQYGDYKNIRYGVKKNSAMVWDASHDIVEAMIPSVICVGKNLYSVNEIGGTELGELGFSGCDSLSSINLPEGLTSIGDNAFQLCSSLSSINLPEGLTSIGDNAFQCCSSLSSINLPKSVTSIGAGAFSDCSNLKNLKLPPSLDYLGSISPDVFLKEDITRTQDGCVYVDGYLIKGGDAANIVVEPGTKLIASDAFDKYGSLSNLNNLSSISLPEGLTGIGAGAFQCCSSLSSVSLPESVTSIGAGAFSDCSSLSSINLPEGLTSIGNYAFGFYSNLRNLKLPSGLEYLGVVNPDVFLKEDITRTQDGCVYVDGYLIWGGYAANIIVEPGTKLIASNVFRKYDSLSSISLPEGLTGIGDYTFYECNNLSSINLPESVTSIGEKAFYGCNGIKEIRMSEKQKESFGGYFPRGCKIITN